MKSALIIIQKPPSSDGNNEPQKYRFAIMQIVEAADKSKTIEMLSDTCFLVHLENGMHSFASILNACIQWSVQYRVLFFEKEPAWIISPR